MESGKEKALIRSAKQMLLMMSPRKAPFESANQKPHAEVHYFFYFLWISLLV